MTPPFVAGDVCRMATVFVKLAVIGVDVPKLLTECGEGMGWGTVHILSALTPCLCDSADLQAPEPSEDLKLFVEFQQASSTRMKAMAAAEK